MRKVYTMGKKLIDFIDITKSYNGNVVLDDLNLYIRGERVSDAAWTIRLRKDHHTSHARWL